MTTYGAVESAGHEPATPMSYVSLLPDVEDDRQRRIPSMRACATMALVAGVGVAAWSAGGRLTAGSTVNLHDIAVPKATDEVSGPEVKNADPTDNDDVVSMDGSRSNTHNTKNNRHESGKLHHLGDQLGDLIEDTDDGMMMLPHDPLATTETRALLSALHDVRDQKKFLFGHQEDNVHGQHWQDRTGDHYWYSDVYNSTGSYPGLFGYSLQANGKDDWDYSEPIKFAYDNQGAVIEILWAAWNPVTLGDENNLTMNACREVVPGGSANEVWTGWLDSMASAIHNLTDATGNQIPVILRMFHENTGTWYWWSTKYCNATDYVEMWNYTQTYLRDEKDVHQLLYTYAPNAPAESWYEAYEEYYPGDDLVDIVGFDTYSYQDTYPAKLLADCQKVSNFSRLHNKLVAISETGILGGIQDVTDPMWYMDNFTDVIMNDPLELCQDVVYSMTWFNRHEGWYWVPNWGETTFPGFKAFHESDYSMFADDAEWIRLRDLYGVAVSAFAPSPAPSTPAPTNAPTLEPTDLPTVAPTDGPTHSPTNEPTNGPTYAPTTIGPTAEPTMEPTMGPTSDIPTMEPTAEPTLEPTSKPTAAPAAAPTAVPTTAPTDGTTTHHSHCGKGCSVASTEDTEDDGEEDDTTTTLRPAWQQHKEDSGPGRNGPPSASP